MDYAIIKLGNKQHRVRDGETLVVDRLPTEEGKTFEPVVLLGDAAVTATVLAHERGPKILIGKYRRRTGYKRHNGFRAATSRVEITIGAGGAKRAAAKARAEGREERRARGRGRGETSEGRPQAASEDRGAARLAARGLREADDRPDHRGGEGLERPRARRGDHLRDRDEGPKGALSALESALEQHERETKAAAEPPRRRAEEREPRARTSAADRGGGTRWHTRKASARRRTAGTRTRSILGVKIFGGQEVRAGQIIVRQRGTRFRPGPGTRWASDDTIFAIRDGKAEFRTSGERRFGRRRRRGVVRRREPDSVEPTLTRRVQRSASYPGEGRPWRRRSLSFRREKYVPKGGPDGGDGGNGGDVSRSPTPDLRDLSALQRRKLIAAPKGGNGRGARKHGANGEDVEIRVPVGNPGL